MSKSLPQWDHYATFLRVMQGGSLSAAARALGLSQPSARRHIEALEVALGVVLFTRAPTGLIPTEVARRLLAPAEDMAATAAAMTRAASGGQDAAGTVRLTCSEVFGVEILPPILAALSRQHAAIEIELSASNTTADLLRRDADIAVRMVRPRQGALVARKLGEVTVGLFASPDYIARKGAPARFADLASHRIIGEDLGHVMADGLAARDLPPMHFSYRTDSDLAQMAALRSGNGIGFIQTRLAGGLTPVLPDLVIRLDLWLAMHEDQRSLPRIRLVYDFLAAHLGDWLRDATSLSPGP